MKQLILFFSTLLLLSACRNAEDAGYSEFFSNDENTLSILVVSNRLDNISSGEMESEGIEKLVAKIHETTSLDIKNNKYDLELDKKPAYVVFSNEEMLYTTYSKDDLYSFLKDYKK